MIIPEYLSNLVINYSALIRQAASHFSLTTSQALHLFSIPVDGISMSNLSHRLGLDTSTLTRNIQKLEKIGLVKRHKSSYDKRVQKVFLKQEAINLIEKIHFKLLENNQTMLKYINLEDQELLSTTLEKLVWALDCTREK